VKQPSSPLIIRKFAGLEVRETPAKQMLAVDVLKAIGQKNASAAWSNLKKQYPEILQETCKYSKGRGRPVDVISLHGAIKLAMVAKGPRAAEFRAWAAKLIEGYETADPALTADLIDRTENPVDLEKLGERIKSKTLVLSLQGEARERGMMRRFDYAKMNDENNVFITGNTANEIKSLRDTEITRDSFSTGELSLLNLTQHAQVTNLKIKDAQGAGEILGSNQEVRDDLRSFRNKYFGPKRRPADKRGQTPTITVDV